MDNAESGPNIVYWGKPRRGIPPMDEKDRVDDDDEDALKVGDDGTLCIDALFEDECIDAAARRKVDEGRLEDDDAVATIREASAPRFLDATKDDIVMIGFDAARRDVRFFYSWPLYEIQV